MYTFTMYNRSTSSLLSRGHPLHTEGSGEEGSEKNEPKLRLD